MRKNWVVSLLVLGTFSLGIALRRGGTTPNTPQPPVIVASLSQRGITQGVTETLFTPAVTGVYRVSFYLAMTTPATGSGTYWTLSLNWRNDTGMEVNNLANLPSVNSPPLDYELNQNLSQYGASPFVFEAVAGQPVTFTLTAPAAPTGTCGLAMTVERLQ